MSPLAVPDLLDAVESLYMDQLKPYGRILRKRLTERWQAAGHRDVDIDVKHLRAVCESCAALVVQIEDGGDWSALVRATPSSFIDVYNPQDVYPPHLWQAASAYFEGLADGAMVLPGGRYSCAQELLGRGCEFLLGRSLGQACHIVQLAISQKKILGYLNGAMVPYGRSQSMIKERCAERQRPCTSGSKGSNTLAGWDTVRLQLEEIMRGVAGSKPIPLSNIKRLFRTRFRMELSETALGHAKLSELFQDPRLAGICSVRLQGHGYVLVPTSEPQLRSNAGQPHSISAQLQPAQTMQFPQNSQPAQALPFVHVAYSPMPFPTSMYAYNGGAVEVPTVCQYAHIPAPPPPPAESPQMSALRGRSRCTPLCLDDVVTFGPPPQHVWGEGSGAVEMVVDAGVTPMCPPGRDEAQLFPRLLGNLHPHKERVEKRMFVGIPSPHKDSLVMPTLLEGVPATPEAWPPLLTPSTLTILRSSVQNTFVHVSALPSPACGAMCRSRSMPRNIGSMQGLCR